MNATSFNPGPGSGACWHCSVYGGLDSSRTNAVCWYEPRAVHIRSMPGNGCAHFSRVPGVDDEPGPPAEFQGSVTGGWRANLRADSSADLYRPGLHPFLESIHQVV